MERGTIGESRAGHLGAERVRQVHLAPTGMELGLMSPGDGVTVGAETIAELRWQEGGAIVGALSPADEDLPALEVDLLEPDGEAFEEAEAAAIEDLADPSEGQLQRFEQRDHVPPGEDGREVRWAPCRLEALQRWEVEIEDAPGQGDERTEGLVLGGGRDAALDREVVEEGRRLGGTEGPRVEAAVDVDELAHPVEGCFLGAEGVWRRREGVDERHGRTSTRGGGSCVRGDDFSGGWARGGRSQWRGGCFCLGGGDEDRHNGICVEPKHGRRGLWLQPNYGERGLWLQMESNAMFGGQRVRGRLLGEPC